jgi:hypothetical protein
LLRARLAIPESGLHIAVRAISDFEVACTIQTSYTRGQRYLTLVANADARKVVPVSQ